MLKKLTAQRKSISRRAAEAYYGEAAAKRLHRDLKAGKEVALKVTWSAHPERMYWGKRKGSSSLGYGASPRHCFLPGSRINHMEARDYGRLNEDEFLWACLAACAQDQINRITDGISCVSFFNSKRSTIYKRPKKAG